MEDVMGNVYIINKNNFITTTAKIEDLIFNVLEIISEKYCSSFSPSPDKEIIRIKTCRNFINCCCQDTEIKVFKDSRNANTTQSSINRVEMYKFAFEREDESIKVGACSKCNKIYYYYNERVSLTVYCK
jgi:hypothetical protein